MPSITRVKRIEFSDSSWGPAGSGLLMINAVAWQRMIAVKYFSRSYCLS
jgi:hypothetical protein